MGIIFFGTKDTPVGIDEQMCYCQACEGQTLADIMVLSSYFHIYYLPLFPVSREVNITCQECGMKSYGLPFNSKVIKNYSEIKNRFKHPWFTYIFFGSIVFLILAAIIYK
ncbi:MAG: hypothetical protein ABI863_22510 [Ginsengibacter sp.]